MKFISARLRAHQHGASRAASVLRRVVEGKNAEFLDRIDLGQKSHTTRRQLVIVNTIQPPVVRVFAPPLHRKRYAAAERDLAAIALIHKIARLLSSRSTGTEQGQLHKVSTI